jgi:hypothetical protein
MIVRSGSATPALVRNAWQGREKWPFNRISEMWPYQVLVLPLQ